METVQSFVKYSNSKVSIPPENIHVVLVASLLAAVRSSPPPAPRCLQGLRLVPQGGNTGLVGGGVPAEEGEVVMNTMRLNRSMSLDEEEGILTLDSGVVLQNAIDYCKERGFVYPVDLGAKGSCAVGGNVSSNAGGVYYNRFGSVSSNLIGLKAVLSTGEVLDLMGTTMRKNSAGFDLKQVFVGGEGNYGIVTKIAMRVHRMPTSRELGENGQGAKDSWSDIVYIYVTNHPPTLASLLALRSSSCSYCGSRRLG